MCCIVFIGVYRSYPGFIQAYGHIFTSISIRYHMFQTFFIGAYRFYLGFMQISYRFIIGLIYVFTYFDRCL